MSASVAFGLTGLGSESGEPLRVPTNEGGGRKGTQLTEPVIPGRSSLWDRSRVGWELNSTVERQPVLAFVFPEGSVSQL